MLLNKPKIKRTHVTLTDPETRKSRCLTLYGTTADEAIDKLRSLAEDANPSPAPSDPQPAALAG